ncbi:MAG: hypothetical protein MUF61_03255 [archaeon]|jgi:hypothetical protein|nr:hypothetical protein [archaeon]
MAVEQITGQVLSNMSLIDIPTELLEKASHLITLFQAVGGFIIAYIVFNILNIVWNRRKAKEFEKMTGLLEQINKKLDKKR